VPAAMLLTMAEATALVVPLLLLPLPLPAALPSALRQPPAAEACELQNESYVSRVAVCAPTPATVLGPGAVGMSKVLGGRRDESEVGAGGCVDAVVVVGAGADGEGFCGDAGARACFDAGGEAAGEGGETSVEAEAGAIVGAGERDWCVWAREAKVVWGLGGKVVRVAEMSGAGATTGKGGAAN
jgi:hypothetical protein